MKVLFHNKTLNYRGVTNSIVDYAHYNQELLGNESTLLYKKNFESVGPDTTSHPDVIEHLSKRFNIISYETETELNRIAEKYDVAYSQKAGFFDDDFITSTRTAVHCVFQYYQPHGDSYAYISEWLAKEMNKICPEETLQFVPYIVNLPPLVPNLRNLIRDVLGVPRDAYVIGRHGGYLTFDLKEVHQALPGLCEQYPNLYFILVNTCDYGVHHPRIKYMSPFFEKESKTSFIAACDAALHARWLGESFGLSICENLFHNIPVLSYEGGFDRNHVHLLKDHNLLYSEKTFHNKIAEIMKRPPENYSSIVAPFTPQLVMDKFKKVFLDF